MEAEMVSRGVIDEPRVTQELGQSIIRTVPRYDTSEEIVPRHGLPSGWNGVIERVFAGLDPWLLPKRAFLEAHDGSADRELLDQLYDDHGAGLVKLVPCLDEPLHFKLSVHVRQNTSVSSTLIRTALACYAKIGFDSKMHFLDVSRAPKDYRSAWPVLHHEYNAKELSDSERWIRDLYEWVEAETKYRVKPGFEYWTVRE